MNVIVTRGAATLFLAAFACMTAIPALAAESFAVTLDPAVHGKYKIKPSLPADGRFSAGTVVTVTAQPDAGYTFDAGYYSTPGRWGAMYLATEKPRLLDALLANSIPFSAINPAEAAACPMSVVSEDRLAVRQLVEEMIRQGHTRIAFAGAGGHVRASRERLAGYLDAIEGLKDKRVRPIIYESSGIAFSDGLAIGRDLFSKSRRPTAIQCITDDMAAGLIAAAHERRLLLPDSLSISGFDNFGLATRLYPALSTATLPLMAMTVAATRQVRDTLEGKPVDAFQRLACSVVLRQSIAKPQLEP